MYVQVERMSPDRQITAQDIDCLKEINKKVKFIKKIVHGAGGGGFPLKKLDTIFVQ